MPHAVLHMECDTSVDVSIVLGYGSEPIVSVT